MKTFVFKETKNKQYKICESDRMWFNRTCKTRGYEVRLLNDLDKLFDVTPDVLFFMLWELGIYHDFVNECVIETNHFLIKFKHDDQGNKTVFSMCETCKKDYRRQAAKD